MPERKVRAGLAAIAALLLPLPALSHDIYSGIHGRNGQLCCGGDDCFQTIWRERQGRYEFQKRDGLWVELPEDRITFLPIPGEPPDGPPNMAHLCYRMANDYDKGGPLAASVFGDIFLYCAFIPPGAI